MVSILYHINAKCTSPHINITFVSNFDSRDWKEDYTVDKIVRGVCDNVKSGSIVLFHNAAKNTPEALPIIIEKLIAEGYRFELISNMIYKEGYEIIHNGTQVKKDG